MSLPQRDAQHHSYADYAHWPDEPRYELIDGVAYAMAEPLRAHQDIVGALFRQIANVLDGSPCRPYLAPLDVRLPVAGSADAEIDTVVQPDILVVCRTEKLDERGCLGAPDWIIEVLSPQTAGHDQIVKRDLYERHGVKEYWLIHPGDRVVTVYALQAGRFGRPDIYEFSAMVTARTLSGVAVDFSLVAEAMSG
jgi:Uma2 family endonuclease